MKALSVKQPWAELIARGEKTIEIRGNATRHRGPLLIVSCKEPNVWTTGCAIAVVDLVDCRPMTKADEGAALGEHQEGTKAWVLGEPAAGQARARHRQAGRLRPRSGSRPPRDHCSRRRAPRIARWRESMSRVRQSKEARRRASHSAQF